MMQQVRALYCLAHGELAWLFHAPDTGFENPTLVLLSKDLCHRQWQPKVGLDQNASPCHAGGRGPPLSECIADCLDFDFHTDFVPLQ